MVKKKDSGFLDRDGTVSEEVDYLDNAGYAQANSESCRGGKAYK